MSNWIKEFKKWLPQHRVVYIGGTKEEREEQLRTHVQPDKFDVVLTSFEIVIRYDSISRPLFLLFLVSFPSNIGLF
jgi:SWI/SNF-related matrix-associated actin-dependent regulator of chromatin subfamily A member 5